MKYARLLIVTGVALARAISGAAAEDLSTRVSTEFGALRGSERDGVVSFLNIPFAAPPIGDLRWRAPQPPARWTGERDATALGASCPQPDRSAGAGGGWPIHEDEDCLALNIWAPRGAKSAPVMVWLHGGGHRVGSATYPIYDGAALAAQGVVLVTINYRLGLLGYFAHPALTAETPTDAPLGNYGFLDQIQALNWVKGNIAAFGGDPENVTVFGESAGGASILYLLASDSARGLIHKAIIQSGGGLQRPETLQQKEAEGVAAAQALGLSADAKASDLRAITAERWINEAQGPLRGAGFGEFIDGRMITEPPSAALLRGAIDMPMIIGANSNEAGVLVELGVPGAALAELMQDRLPDLRAAYGGAAISDAGFQRQAMGDAFFVAPARWVAEKTAAGAPTYLYHFNYVAERRRDQTPGANHGSEIPYVFKTWSAIPFASRFLTPADYVFSDMISACWVSFAKTGAPKCAPAPKWPRYDTKSDALLEFGVPTGVRKSFRKRQLDLLLEAGAPEGPKSR